MCGRFAALTKNEIIEIREILRTLSLIIARDDFHDYNPIGSEVLPTDLAPAITRFNENIFFESIKWGFKKWNNKGVIINARCETIKEKITFSKLVNNNRCIIPTSKFFEWENLKTEKKKYFIKNADDNILFMAGLYHNNEGEREFVIITKNATGEMAKIHERMPVILRIDQIMPWFTGNLSVEEIIQTEYDIIVKPCKGKE